MAWFHCPAFVDLVAMALALAGAATCRVLPRFEIRPPTTSVTTFASTGCCSWRSPVGRPSLSADVIGGVGDGLRDACRHGTGPRPYGAHSPEQGAADGEECLLRIDLLDVTFGFSTRSHLRFPTRVGAIAAFVTDALKDAAHVRGVVVTSGELPCYVFLDE